MPANAFAYLRVSGLGQVDGDGFPRQEAAIRAFAAGNGYDVARVFFERGITGKSDLEDRPALGDLVVSLEADQSVKVVLIEKLDRLARDLMVQETIIGDLKKKGVTLISAMEPDLCSDDPTRKLMRQIMGAIAEYDRAMIVLKLRAARQRMKAKTGRCEGPQPFGQDEQEREVIDRIRSMRLDHRPVRTIAELLNLEGAPTRRPGTRWSATQVMRILRRMEAN